MLDFVESKKGAAFKIPEELEIINAILRWIVGKWRERAGWKA